ncbi:MAG: HAD family phosphatase [Clostridia bacterium]|nr:HAD family phosphatase [Clostridia bacterium]
MEKYLLASDYDCTLRRWPDDVTEEDRAAIRRFREAGNHFIIVTGRMYFSAIGELENSKFNDMDLLLSMSGALMTDKDGEVIHEDKGDGAVIGGVLKVIRELSGRLAVVNVGKTSYSVKDYEFSYTDPKVTDEEAAKLPYFTNMCTCFNGEKEAAEAGRIISEKYGYAVNPLCNGCSVDLPPATTNKGIAVQRAAELLGVKNENIYAVGDNYNDIDMVKRYHGRAMKGSPDALVNAAEKTVSTIAEIIDEIMSK